MSSKQKSPRKEARRPVWAEVDLGALAENFHAIRKFVNPPGEKRKTPRKILCIVKGNGYGHGGPQVAKALEKAGSDWFGVTCTEEGMSASPSSCSPASRPAKRPG
jgi:alanine racemase